MIGIGGGIPSKENDIRLEDVVVGTHTGQHGGVVQWDFGKTQNGGYFKRTGALNSPPTILKTALSRLGSTYEMGGCRIPEHLSNMMAGVSGCHPSSLSQLQQTYYLKQIMITSAAVILVAPVI
jgi:hypothetical protein